MQLQYGTAFSISREINFNWLLVFSENVFIWKEAQLFNVGKIRDLLSNGSSIEMIIDSELRSKLSNCYSVQATKFYWFAGRSSAFLFMFQTIAYYH